MVIIYESPLAAVEFLELEGAIPDDARLQELCRRNMPYPVEVRYQITAGVLEVLLDCDDQPKLVETVASYTGACEHLAHSRSAEAIPFLRRLLAVNPYFVEGRAELMRMLVNIEKSDEAIDEIVEGLRLDPENPDYYSMAAVLLPETPDMTLARRHYAARAIELKTTDPSASYVMGSIELDDGNIREAQIHFDRMLAQPCGVILGRYGRARVFCRMSRFKSAAGELEAFFTLARNREDETGVLKIARSMYLDCCAHLTKRTAPRRLQLARRELAMVEAEYGWCIELRVAPPAVELAVPSQTLLWQSRDRPGSLVISGSREALASPDYLIAHALEIRMETLPSGTKVIQNLRQQAARLARNSSKAPDDLVADGEDLELATAALATVQNFCAGLIYLPANWQIHSRTMTDFPVFKWSSLFHLYDGADRCLPLLDHTAIRYLMTPDGYTGFLAMLGANALFLLDISGGAIDLTTTYRQLPTWSRSLGIIDHWKNRMEKHFKQGDETDLLNEIAVLAGFSIDIQMHVQGRLL